MSTTLDEAGGASRLRAPRPRLCEDARPPAAAVRRRRRPPPPSESVSRWGSSITPHLGTGYQVSIKGNTCIHKYTSACKMAYKRKYRKSYRKRSHRGKYTRKGRQSFKAHVTQVLMKKSETKKYQFADENVLLISLTASTRSGGTPMKW